MLNYKKIINSANSFKDVLSSETKISIKKPSGLEPKYPLVLQLPITYKCNSRCVMCNIPNMKVKKEMSLEEFDVVIKDSIFKKINSVGVNGGEPFLLPNLVSYVKIILTLPNIKNFNIITNGFLTNKVLEDSHEIYKLCKAKQVKFHISISLDGYGEIHDLVRGVPNAFERTMNTIYKLKEQRKEYCDTFDTGCTISKQNVDYTVQLLKFCKMNRIPLKFRLAIDNKRIESCILHSKFSIFTSQKSMQTAKEFFFRLHKENLHDRKYLAILHYLSNKKNGRIIGCDWQNEGITLDAYGNIYYCAVESKPLGNILNESGEKIFFNKNNLKYRHSIIKNKCKRCIHDYNGKNYLINEYKFHYYSKNL